MWCSTRSSATPRAAAVQVLADGGRLVNLGSAGGETAVLSSALLRSRSISVLGYTNNSLRPAQRADALTAVLTEAAAGRLSVEHTVLPLADCAAGWQRAIDGGPRVVLEPGAQLARAGRRTSG